jgi:integration host factor subunit beta
VQIVHTYRYNETLIIEKQFNMTRSNLVFRLHDLHPQLQLKDVDMAVKVILDAIADTLVTGGHAEIRGFGSFSLRHRPPRIGRNPKTGERVEVPEKYVPHFKTGKEMRERVDR